MTARRIEEAKLVAKGQNKMTPLQFSAMFGDEGREEQVCEFMKWVMEDLEKKREKEHSWIWKGKDDKYDIRLKDMYTFRILQHAIKNTNSETEPVVVEVKT